MIPLITQLLTFSSPVSGPNPVDPNVVRGNDNVLLRIVNAIRTWILGNSWFNPLDYGAAGNGTTDDTASVNAAIAAAAAVTPQGKVWLQSGYTFLVTSLTNTSGVQIVGPGRIETAVTGGVTQISSYADVDQHIFGREYLGCFHQLLENGTAASVVMTGDSTTAGTGVTTPYIPTNLLATLAASVGVSTVTFYNRGQSGKNSADWVSTYLAGDLVAAGGSAGSLMIIRWGINDAYIPTGVRTLAQYTASMRSALTTIRASYGVNTMSILLMTPNALSNTPQGPDEKWNEAISDALRQMARDFHCCFYDTYAVFRDSRTMTNVSWDSIGTHPKDILNAAIFSDVAPLLFLPGLGYTGGFRNYTGSSRTILTTTAVSFFGIGGSLDRAAQTNDPLWPYDGAVLTYRQADGTYARQDNWPYQTTFPTTSAYRTGNASGWNTWKYLPAGPEQNINSPLTLLNSWVEYATDVRHVNMPGTTDGSVRVTTPDSAALSGTGDSDERIGVALESYASTANQILESKLQSDGQASRDFYVEVTTGKLVYRWTPDGLLASLITVRSTVACGVTARAFAYLRRTHTVNNGAGGNDVKFYKSNSPSAGVGTLTVTGGAGVGTFTTSQAGLLAVGDYVTVNTTDYLVTAFNGTTGVTLYRCPNVAAAAFSLIGWTQIGTTVTTAGVTSVFDGTNTQELGANHNGTGVPMTGKLYRADFLSGINGTPVASFNPQADAVDGATTITAGGTGEVWTLYGCAVHQDVSRATKGINGFVWLHGTIKSGTLTSSTVIANLAAGYRPADTCYFLGETDTNGTPATLYVSDAGAVTIQYCPSAGRLSLDGISFYAA